MPFLIIDKIVNLLCAPLNPPAQEKGVFKCHQPQSVNTLIWLHSTFLLVFASSLFAFFLFPLQSVISDHAIAQVVRCWLVTTEAQVESQVSSYEICSGLSGTGANISLGFFDFSVAISIPPFSTLLCHCLLRCMVALIKHLVITSSVFKLCLYL
jgi:hypothetical protein